MEQMTWNNDKYRYEYLLASGDLLCVDGDEFIEQGARHGEVLDEQMLEPTQWENCIGDNLNVFIIPGGKKSV